MPQPWQAIAQRFCSILFYLFLSVYHNYNLSIKQKILIPTDFSTKYMTTYYYTSSKKLSQSLLKNRIRISDILSINIFSLTNIILVRYPAPSVVNFTILIITSKANSQTTFYFIKKTQKRHSPLSLYTLLQNIFYFYFSSWSRGFFA